MNEDIIKGNWKKMSGEVQKKWGKLTNDQLDRIEGSRTKLIGSLQENYGFARDEAEKQVRDWEKKTSAA